MDDGASAASAAPRSLSLSATWPPAAVMAAAAILLLALALRILCARGELWLDELWSLKLIDEMRARHDLLWGLPLDNNHYLNTLYLAIVGADAPVLVQRAWSILLGTATVAVAARAAKVRDPVEPLAAMALFAVSYPMVGYGSEARGYAGLILATLCAVVLTERAAMGGRSDRLKLGIVNVIGFLFQPIMLGGIGALIAWTAWLRLPTGRRSAVRAIPAAIRGAAETFVWTIRMLLPVGVILIIAVFHAGGYVIAGPVPFTAKGFVAGYGGLVRLLLGLPDAVPDWIGLAIAALALSVAAALPRPADDRRLGLYIALMLVLPLAMFVVRLPNIHFQRYYLASGTVLLLLLADLFAQAWRRGGLLRGLALLLAAAIVLGNGMMIARVAENGRDRSAAMVQLLARDGPALVTSDQDVRDRPVVEYFARRLNLPLTYVPTADICARKPVWLISSSVDRQMPDRLDTAGRFACSIVFRKVATFPQWGLSGLPWVVYHAE